VHNRDREGWDYSTEGGWSSTGTRLDWLIGEQSSKGKRQALDERVKHLPCPPLQLQGSNYRETDGDNLPDRRGNDSGKWMREWPRKENMFSWGIQSTLLPKRDPGNCITEKKREEKLLSNA